LYFPYPTLGRAIHRRPRMCARRHKTRGRADYVIDYRQRPAANLDASAFAGTKRVIFCMSTTVVGAAKAALNIPLDGMPANHIK
jgi:hypothetical protein